MNFCSVDSLHRCSLQYERTNRAVRIFRLIVLLVLNHEANAFSPTKRRSHSNIISPPRGTSLQEKGTLRRVILTVKLRSSGDNCHNMTTRQEEEPLSTSSPPPAKANGNTESILRRFTSPVIDDPFLPLTDVLVAQIVAPSLQISWLSLLHAPSPSWIRPVVDTSVLYSQGQGSYLAPTLIHGAALASCWVVGALAAQAYRQDAIAPVSRVPNQQQQQQQQQQPPGTGGLADYARVLLRVCQAGAFATGLLILCTQLDLFLEFRGQWVSFGDSPESDFRLWLAAVELGNDVCFEAGSLLTWRLFLAASSSSRP